MKGQEYKTSLRNGVFVEKDNQEICFRGKIDSLHAHIALCGALAISQNETAVAQDLETLAQSCFTILSAGVNECDVVDSMLLGLSPEEIREISHNPQEYGISHFMAKAEDGKLICCVNIIRTLVREVETMAVALYRETMPGIILLLNRMSSAAYIIMCRLKAEYYSK